MESIPKSALNLMLGFKEYEEIARNINRISLISMESRKEILRKGDETFSHGLIERIFRLQEDMAYDREVYRLAGLDYSRGPPEGEQLFISGIVDYLVRFYENHPDRMPK